MKILRVIALGMIVCACRDATTEDFNSVEDDNSLINYFFEVKSFGEYDYLTFSFNYLNADQLGRFYRTVYLHPKKISIANSQQHRINLGASTIEPLPIKGYSFGASQFYVHKRNEVIPLVLNDFMYAEADLDVVKQDTLDIIFELDLESSIVLDSAGVDWLIPKINVVKQ